MDVCIKNIEEEDWRIFKSESIRHGLKVGDFFGKIIEEHESACSGSNWDNVLKGEKTCKGLLTRNDFKKLRSEFRKNFGMRR
jgi:hypothetical protein